jgi:DNA helicase II / ATP-dependent DNA helicase PcrA
MRFIADLHIHSKYARAVSRDMVLDELDRWAAAKGILVMGTGDFTHPDWVKEIKTKLEPAEPGLFRLKKEFKKPALWGKDADTRFMLSSEISCIYTRGGRGRRVHHLVFAPDIETMDNTNTQLSWTGNLRSDGRPIIGMDSEDLAKLVFGVNPEAVIIPAHAWTPWFSIFGSMSGFDTIEECFGKYTDKIFALETGLSSDPAMNWRLSRLDNIAFISNSDSHSLQRIGREANVFDTELSYKGIMDAIKANDPKKFVMTLEFFPEEGKYHYDGHRDCGVYLSPEETKNLNGKCSKCGKGLTIGVMNRVAALADSDRGPDYRDERRVPFKNMIPLDEIVAEAFGVGTASKKVKEMYGQLIEKVGPEIEILFNADLKAVEAIHPGVAEGIQRVREGKVKIRPGYDGEYGEISIFGEEERKFLQPQKSLF